MLSTEVPAPAGRYVFTSYTSAQVAEATAAASYAGAVAPRRPAWRATRVQYARLRRGRAALPLGSGGGGGGWGGSPW